MSDKIRSEIALAAGAVLAAINAIQVAAIPLPTWAHTAIAVVSILAGSLVVRQNVTPWPPIARPLAPSAPSSAPASAASGADHPPTTPAPSSSSGPPTT